MLIEFLELECGCLLKEGTYLTLGAYYQFHKEVSLFCNKTINKTKIINDDIPRQNLNMILQLKLGAAFS